MTASIFAALILREIERIGYHPVKLLSVDHAVSFIFIRLEDWAKWLAAKGSVRMTIVDRYLFAMFVRIFLISFFSFTGLFIVIHLFSNLDELTALSSANGWPQLMWEFYGPRVAEVFDKTGAVWALVAAVFAVNLMQRRRELTAMEAAGVTKSRILRSVFVCAVAITGLLIANREMVLPQVKDRLVRTPQNWANQRNIDMGVFHDPATGIKVRGEQLNLPERLISVVEVQIPGDVGGEVSLIRAQTATVEPATDQHPRGLWVRNIDTPPNTDLMATLFQDQRPVVLGAQDHPWLEPGECFVICDFDAEQVAYGKKLLDYQSLREMIGELRKPKLWFGNGPQINAHSRILQPVLDLTLLMLGLPLIINRSENNVFVSAGMCFLIVGAMQVGTIACHSLGTYSLLRPAVLAVWLPAILFVPLAVVAMYRINR